MRRMLYALVLLGAGVVAGDTRGDVVGSGAPEFRSIKALEYGGSRFVAYGDARGVFHVIRKDSTGAVEEWEGGPLESAIGGVFCGDLDRDGALEALAYSLTGSIMVFDLETRRRAWSNRPDEFDAITCLTVANIDDDAQDEIIFCADLHLEVYDAKTQLREWESIEEFEAQDIEVGDVDEDGQLEIVLNTGYVLDARFHDLEWQTEGFGERIALFDVDDDSIPEVIGEFSNGVIKVYDADLRREKW